MRAAHAGGVGRAAARQLRHQHAVIDRQPQRFGQRRGDGVAQQAKRRVAVLPLGHQYRHDAPQRLDRHGKPDALGPFLDGGVDADHLAARIEQRPAGVAGVDGRVGLDDVEDVVAGLRFQGPAQGTDHARRQRPVKAERVANGDGPLADTDRLGRAQGERLQRCGGRIDAQHGQVVARVYAHHLGFHLAIVGEDNFDAAGIFDHVIVGDDVAGIVPDEA